MNFTAFLSTIVSFIMMVLSLINPGLIKEPEAVPRAETAQYRVITFNLRYGGSAAESVKYRSKLMLAELSSKDADVMGFQEATPEWMGILASKLESYAYISEYRTGDEREGTEANPVFYKKDKFDLVDSGTFWLSETPDVVGSKYPGAGCERVCTFAVLRDKALGRDIAFLNTHLDNVSYAAIYHGMTLINSKIKEFILKDYPIILTGDFNSVEGSGAYNAASVYLNDTKYQAPVTDSGYTYHDYGKQELLLDYIFASNKVTPLRYSIIRDKINKSYLSDHYGIFVDFRID